MSIQLPKNDDECHQTIFNEIKYQEGNILNESFIDSSSSSTKQKDSEKKKPSKQKNIKPDNQLTRYNIVDRKYPKIRLSKKTLDTLKTLKDQTDCKTFTDLMNEMISSYILTHPSIHLTIQSDESEEEYQYSRD